MESAFESVDESSQWEESRSFRQSSIGIVLRFSLFSYSFPCHLLRYHSIHSYVFSSCLQLMLS